MQARSFSVSGSRWGRVLILLLLGALLSVAGCRKDNDYEDRMSAPQLYEQGKKSLDAGNWDRAVRSYKALQTRYPFGRYTEQSMLDLSYAYFKARQPESALSTLDRFIRTYPAHPNVDYAYYLKGPVSYTHLTLPTICFKC